MNKEDEKKITWSLCNDWWRWIAGYEWVYLISEFGQVLRVRKNGDTNGELEYKLIKPHKTRDGYLQVDLLKDGERRTYSLHRLVGQAFIPNPNNSPEINHIDKNKTNNYFENLEWCDRKYNVAYSRGIKVVCVETGNAYQSLNEAARENKIKNSHCIKRCCDGLQSHCGGLHWEYA